MFGIGGGHITPLIMGSGIASGVKLVHIRHGQSGGCAADAYARASGKVKVCFGTAGPGMTCLRKAFAAGKTAAVDVVTARGIPRPMMAGSRAEEIRSEDLPILTRRTYLKKLEKGSSRSSLNPRLGDWRKGEPRLGSPFPSCPFTEARTKSDRTRLPQFPDPDSHS